jgi:hypothetical protein
LIKKLRVRNKKDVPNCGMVEKKAGFFYKQLTIKLNGFKHCICQANEGLFMSLLWEKMGEKIT